MKKLVSGLAVALALLVGAGALAGDKEAEKAEKDAKGLIQRGLAAGDKGAVLKGLEAIGGQGAGDDAAKFVIEVALKLDDHKKFSAEASNDIFDAAELALATIKDPKAEEYLYENLSGKKPHRDIRVRVFLCDVASKRKSEAAEAALIAALDDKSPLVQKPAIQYLALRKSKRAFDPIIALVAKVEKRRDEPWLDCMRFLASLTGKDFGTAQDWKGWWDANKDKFDPAQVTVDPNKPVGETVSRGAPEFFDTTVLSKKCVFILDVSGSMAIKDSRPETGGGRGKPVTPKEPGYGEVPNERMRMWRLKEAMVKLLKDLPADTQFTILTFGSSVRDWQRDLVPASAKNKEDATAFAESMNPEGFTVTDEALRAAFDVGGEPNTFYLFSDGIPQRGKKADGTPDYIDRQEIIEEVAQLNRVRKVKLFTIGVGEADASFMRQLAVANGGKFVQVD